MNYVSKGTTTRANAFQLAAGNGNYIYLDLFKNSGEAARCVTTVMAPGQTWQHVAVTYDGSNIIFYINGVLNASCAITASAGAASDPLMIGGNDNTSPTGVMDELRIYQRALSAQEITSVYNDPGLPPYAISVTVNPLTASLAASETQSFNAAVTGNTNTAVTWSLSPSVGTVSAAGAYTAPPVSQPSRRSR